jgi:hypothetical protein
MKMKLVSRGGWSANLRRPPLAVDTEQLPPAQATRAMDLAAAAEKATEDEKAAAEARGRAPEAMSYEIIVEHDDRTVTLKGSDVGSSPEFEALRDWLEAEAPRGAAGS